MRLFGFFLIYFFSWNSLANSLDETLCGKKPLDKTQENSMKYDARKLERLMPPVSNQSPASWCYAFAATDALNYHNFLSEYRRSQIQSQDFYNETKNMVSPIDSVAAAVRFRNNGKSGTLDVRKGGNSMSVFTGFQESGFKARSSEQVYFNSLDDDSPRTKAIVRNLRSEYRRRNGITSNTGKTVAGHFCEVGLYNSEKFESEVKSFNTINDWLLGTAKANNFAPSNFEINNYERITSFFKKEEDIRMDHYVTNKYNGQNQFKFLQLIRSSLYPSKGGIGNPVTVALCSKSIRSQSSQFGSRNDTQCGNHIVNVVGAYYENGQCKVRIRNSWGNDWEDNGHISITVSEFLASQELYSKVNKTSDLYNATWIKGTHSNSLAASTRDIDDNGYFEGVYDYTFQDGKEIQRQVKKGVPSRRKRHDGTVTEVFHIRLRNGNTYSGTVNDRNNGQWGLKSGLETDSNGRLVYAHKYRLHNGQIYTGRIKETTNGEFRTLD